MKVRHDPSISPNPPSEAPNPPGRPVPGAKSDTVSAKKKTGLALAQIFSSRPPHPPPDAGTDTSFSSFPGDVSGTLIAALRQYHKGKAAANNGRHDVAVQRFTEVRPSPLITSIDTFQEPAPQHFLPVSDVQRQFWIVR